MTITITDYFRDRREKYPLAMTPDIERNAMRTVELANSLIAQAETYGVPMPPISPITGTQVASGWRPPAINAATKNAATNSMHMTGEAIDVYDPDGALDLWLMTGEGQAALVALGLWIEHPSATGTWSHLQTRPPKSGKRVFYP